MNIVVFSGNIASDIELKYTQSGIPVTSFNLAVRRPGAKESVTDFFPIVAWRSTAEFICNHFQKGDGIEVQCIATTRKYEDKNHNRRTATEFVADRVDFGKAKKPREPEPQENNVANEQNYTQEGFTEYDGDDLPF